MNTLTFPLPENRKRRFYASFVVGDGPCWNWIAGKTGNGSGYGQFALKGKKGWRPHTAPRVSWFIHKGSIPKGLCVLHQCDNPACVRPSHLFLGTRTENAADKVRKSRQSRGESSGLNKLKVHEVRQIRQLVKTKPQRELATRFGVGADQISRIASRKRWGWLED